jgi:hypothetical protein
MPRPVSQVPAPSQTDLEILAVLWDRPSATGREIYDALLDAGRLRRRVRISRPADGRVNRVTTNPTVHTNGHDPSLAKSHL